MKKMLSLFVLIFIPGLVFAGNPPKKMVPKLDKGESSDAVPAPIRSKINESSVFVGNAANAYAWQASGTNQIYYDAVSSTLAIVKRRGSLDTQIPAGSGRIVVQKATDQGSGQSWSEGVQINGNLSQVIGRHPNIAILPTGQLITQWAELYPLGAGFQALGMATNTLSDNSQLSAYLDLEIVADIDDVAGNDTVGYGVPDEIFVDEKNGTFYFGGAADNLTNTVYLWKSSDKGSSHHLVKLWKDSWYGGISSGVNNSHGDFCGDYGTYIISIMPDSAIAAQNQMDPFKYSPYIVRFKYGSIVEEGFFDLSGLFSTIGIDSWTSEWDMVTDKKGNWHLFIQGYKEGETATNVGIYEIYSTTPGLTDIHAKKVADITLVDRVIDAANSLYGAADIHAARDAKGKYVFVKYLDWDPADDPETTTEMYVSGRAITSESFVNPIAVNDNDLAVQNFTQAAPRVSSLGNGDSQGTRKFQIHSTWVEFGGTPASGTSPANLYYSGTTLDLPVYYNENDSATVTFKVNTAFVQDTLSAGSSVSIRGAAFGGDWSLDKGIKFTSIGGDYWNAEKTVPTGKSGGTFKIVTSTQTGTGWDRHTIGEFEVKNDTTLTYYTTGLKETYTDPFTGAEITRGDDWDPLEIAKNGNADVYAVHFRVNMQEEKLNPGFNPETQKVTVRGSFNGWSSADTLKPESRHDDLCCGLGTYEAENFYSKTILIPKTSAGNLDYKFVYSDAVTTTWENSFTGNRKFTLSGDTTLYWDFFRGNKVIDPFFFENYKVRFEVDLEKAINTNGFDKFTDTLIVRIGFLGTGKKTVDAKLSAPFMGTVFTGETGNDSLAAIPGSAVMYKYYKKNAAGELEEFYFDNFNTLPQSAAPKFRKAVAPVTGNSFSTEDLANDNVSTHRQPFFRNTNPVGVPTTLTLEVDANSASFWVYVLKGKLNDFQNGSLVVDTSNIKKLPLFINGPASGGWTSWDSVSLGITRRFAYLGCNRWEISIAYPAEATVSQEFRLSLGGADNEAGSGLNHVVNLFPPATNHTKIQFGEIQPLRYYQDDQNYWDFQEHLGIIHGQLYWPCFADHVTPETPQTFSLSAFPNPFNPATLISCTVPVSGRLILKVYDLQGRQVAVLLDEVRPAGVHQVPFRAEGLSSGVYLVRMQSGNRQEALKVILVK